MTDLNSKIYDNIVEQLTLKMKSERLQSELQSLERRGNTIIGRMSVLAEMYEEQNNRSLDADINQSEEWAPLLEKAREEAQRVMNEEAQAVAAATPSLRSEAPLRPVKAVKENKQPTKRQRPAQVPQPPKQPAQESVSEPEQVPSVGKVVVEDASSDGTKPNERTPTADRSEPIKFTIDDSPPVAPEGTPVTDLDEG